MFTVGQIIIKTEEPITRDQILNYSKASGDSNPIHINEEFAIKVGLKGVIAHGMLSFGMVNRYISDLATENNAELLTIGCEMRGMVRPGDWLICTIEVESVEDKVVSFNIIQNSKMPLKLEKDGQIVKVFEGEERGWVSDKEIGGIKTEDTPEGTLTYREWLVTKHGQKSAFHKMMILDRNLENFFFDLHCGNKMVKIGSNSNQNFLPRSTIFHNCNNFLIVKKK